MTKRRYIVILDGRNRELGIVWEDKDVSSRIEGLKLLGKKPFRTIIKVK